jgi:hypothetical protein
LRGWLEEAKVNVRNHPAIFPWKCQREQFVMNILLKEAEIHEK